MAPAAVTDIVPAVNDFPQLRVFLKSAFPRCVLMHWRLSDLDAVFAALRAAGRTALVHCDLIGGLSPDEAAAEFVAERLRPEGLISTKTAAVAAAKRLGLTSVQRVFLIDSAALARSAAAVSRAAPDYVEFLPAPCPSVYPRLRAAFGVPLIAGRAEAASLLACPEIEAVTVSMATLAK